VEHKKHERRCLFLYALGGTMAAIHPWWGCMYFNAVKENGRPHRLDVESLVGQRRLRQPVVESFVAQPLLEA